MKPTRKSRYAASFGQLRHGGILESRRGAPGGYCLAIPAEEVTVLDIVETLYGEAGPARYLHGGGYHTDDAPPCPTREVWDGATVAPEGASNRYGVVQFAEAERGSPDRQVTRGPPGPIPVENCVGW